MKTYLCILIVILFTNLFSYGQQKRVPKNIKSAVRLLHKTSSDSLKALIRKTEDKDLKKLSYPWGNNFKTIFEWTAEENEHSKLVQYLELKGVSAHVDEVLLIAFKRSLLGLPYNEASILKPYQDIEAKWEAENKVRFIIDSLDGIYIPKDLNDCFRQINTFWTDSTRNKIRNLTEEEFSGRLHLGFGMWMRNNWQLWGGSRLSMYFNEKGIYHPDDMTGIILDSYHRMLNDKDIKLDEQIKYYQEYWKESNQRDKIRKEQEFSMYKVGEIVTYKYNLGFVNKRQEEKFEDNRCIAKGRISDLNLEKFIIKVQLIESCSRKGVIYYDNKNYKIYNEETNKWERPKKRVIKRMKEKQENWFNYDDWETLN